MKFTLLKYILIFSIICSQVGFANTDTVDGTLVCEKVAEEPIASFSLLRWIKEQLGLVNKKPKKKNIKLIKIEKLKYKVSKSKFATFCKRDPKKTVSYIVIHHTGTETYTTPHAINSMHLDNGHPNDPWYMIGYNYVISSSYGGATTNRPKVFEGRPPEMRGAHAGGHTKRLTKMQRLFYKKQSIQCGNPTTGFKKQTALHKEQQNEEGGISGNLVSFGVAVIGNYSPVTYERIGGIQVPKNILASKQAKITPQMIKTTAKLICQLQRDYPNIKKIVPHDYFRKTLCPGSIRKALTKINNEARKLGCNFDVIFTKKDEK